MSGIAGKKKSNVDSLDDIFSASKLTTNDDIFVTSSKSKLSPDDDWLFAASETSSTIKSKNTKTVSVRPAVNTNDINSGDILTLNTTSPSTISSISTTPVVETSISSSPTSTSNIASKSAISTMSKHTAFNLFDDDVKSTDNNLDFGLFETDVKINKKATAPQPTKTRTNTSNNFNLFDDDIKTKPKSKTKTKSSSQIAIETLGVLDDDIFGDVDIPGIPTSYSSTEAKMPKTDEPSTPTTTPIAVYVDHSSEKTPTSTLANFINTDDNYDGIENIETIKTDVAEDFEVVEAAEVVEVKCKDEDKIFIDETQQDLSTVSPTITSQPATFSLIDDNMFALFDKAATSATSIGNAALHDLNMSDIKNQVRSLLDEGKSVTNEATLVNNDTSIIDTKVNAEVEGKSSSMKSGLFNKIDGVTLDEDIIFTNNFTTTTTTTSMTKTQGESKNLFDDDFDMDGFFDKENKKLGTGEIEATDEQIHTDTITNIPGNANPTKTTTVEKSTKSSILFDDDDDTPISSSTLSKTKKNAKSMGDTEDKSTNKDAITDEADIFAIPAKKTTSKTLSRTLFDDDDDFNSNIIDHINARGVSNNINHIHTVDNQKNEKKQDPPAAQIEDEYLPKLHLVSDATSTFKTSLFEDIDENADDDIDKKVNDEAKKSEKVEKFEETTTTLALTKKPTSTLFTDSGDDDDVFDEKSMFGDYYEDDNDIVTNDSSNTGMLSSTPKAKKKTSMTVSSDKNRDIFSDNDNGIDNDSRNMKESSLYSRAGVDSRAQLLNFNATTNTNGTSGISSNNAIPSCNTVAAVTAIDDATGKVTVLRGLVLPSEAVSHRGEEELVTIETDQSLYEISDISMLTGDYEKEKKEKEKWNSKSDVKTIISPLSPTQKTQKKSLLFDDDGDDGSLSLDQFNIITNVRNLDEIVPNKAIETVTITAANDTKKHFPTSSFFDDDDNNNTGGSNIDDNFDFEAYIKKHDTNTTNGTTRGSLSFLDD